MNPRYRLNIILIVFWCIAVIGIVIYLLICGFNNIVEESFQGQFDPQMPLCYAGECALLDFYPESGGGMVGVAMNWMILIDADGSAILRHGDPYWHGAVGILDGIVYFW